MSHFSHPDIPPAVLERINGLISTIIENSKPLYKEIAEVLEENKFGGRVGFNVHVDVTHNDGTDEKIYSLLKSAYGEQVLKLEDRKLDLHRGVQRDIMNVVRQARFTERELFVSMLYSLVDKIQNINPPEYERTESQA